MDNDQKQNNQAPQDDPDMMDPDDVRHQAAKPPSVTGEEDAMSGDMPAESPEIDEELEKVGKKIDPEHPEPLNLQEDLAEEVE